MKLQWLVDVAILSLSTERLREVVGMLEDVQYAIGSGIHSHHPYSRDDLDQALAALRHELDE